MTFFCSQTNFLLFRSRKRSKLPKESKYNQHQNHSHPTSDYTTMVSNSLKPNDSCLSVVISEASLNTRVFSESSNLDEVSCQTNCQTNPLSLRSFGDDLELIPFIDSNSVPGSRTGSVKSPPAPVENLNRIEDFPQTSGSSFKNRRPIMSSPFNKGIG